ncbi:MAG: glycosyltransferase [Halanaerobiales bacterium]|nr:glycosyltransferase [Halanaerobiales bacterium]
MKPKASVIIPTFNRKDILKKTLLAITNQSIAHVDYEVILVDDGSTDGTDKMVQAIKANQLIRYIYQPNSGRAIARNNGIHHAKGEIIIFIDSDIVVNHIFVESHLKEHKNHKNTIVNGVVINTSNFEDPTSEEHKITDYSRASFATGNSSVRKEFLLKAGLFDEEFNQYGWEDLELGHRLLDLGLQKIKVIDAIGYHYNPPVSLDYLPQMLKKEKERGKMALLFYAKNPTIRTRLTTLYAWPFFLLERLLNLGGWPDWKVTENLLEFLKKTNRKRLFRFISQFKLIHAYFNGMREGLRESRK